MSLSKAKEINKFLLNNNIGYVNVMGGEFFMHPDWFDIITALCDGVELVRVVTNGDWAGVEDEKINLLAKNLPVYFAISKDRWHTNESVEAAVSFCLDNDIPHKVATEDQTRGESVVPIGRSEFEYNLYSAFMRYCTKPDRKYSFLIDEHGVIFKCPLGAWDYADTSEYVDGGFDERFKEFTSTFYSEFIPNCSTCIRIWRRHGNRRKDVQTNTGSRNL
jgi:hypothetical protein